MLQGKKLSILGDSISTYHGISDSPDYQKRLYYNPSFYRLPFPVEKTYWHRVMERLGLSLCVNNSFSGGNLCGEDNEDSGERRAAYLSNSDGEVPDLIIVFMGINDLGRGIATDVFAASYERTLFAIKAAYPKALVCAVTLPDRAAFIRARTEAFNAAIERAVANAGENFFIADLFHSRLQNDFYYINTVDGLHPDEDGMAYIAEVVEAAIRRRLEP